MSYAEQNRQRLKSCAVERCILINSHERVLEMLEAGETVVADHFMPKHYNAILMLIIAIFLLPICVLALLPEMEIPFETSVGGVSTGTQYLRAIDILPFVIIIVLIALLLSIVIPILSMAFSAIRLNRLWAEGILVVSQRVEVGEPRDSDFNYGVSYEFIAPNGQRIAGHRNTDRIGAHAKLQPIMLMLYKSPKDYMVL